MLALTSPGEPIQAQTVPHKAGGLLQFYRQLVAPPTAPTKLQSAVVGIRHNAEGALVGAALGFAEQEFGGLDYKDKYPVDAITAVLLYLFSVREGGATDGFAADLAAMSQSCTTVYAFRKTQAWRRSLKDGSAEKPTSSTDPLIQAARGLGV